ncbi:MAG: hypothetical protein IT366_06865 [Candidatus Hydrogenedentes bacterium]|nr:hypothetical protein [Candidatus Hydrogenedentota bacterium]
MKRILLTAIGIPMIGVFIPNALIYFGYVARGYVHGLDYFWLALPLFPSAIGFALCVGLWWKSRFNRVVTGIAWSLACVSSAFCIFQGYMLTSDFDGIAHDGTTHWGMLQIPVVILWLPAMFAAALVGAVAVYAVNYAKLR